MITINLLAAERKVVTSSMAAPSGGLPMLLGAGSILVLCVAVAGWRYWLLTENSNRLDQEIATAQESATQLQRAISQAAQLEQRKLQLQQRVTLIEKLRGDQTGPVHLLDQISRALPPMVWLTGLQQIGRVNEVVISGRCTTLTELSDFVTNLENSGYFRKSIEIVSSTTEPMAIPPGELVKFEIKAIFQQPGAPPADVATAKLTAADLRSNN